MMFEEKIAKSPGDANIRKRLDIAYKSSIASKTERKAIPSQKSKRY